MLSFSVYIPDSVWETALPVLNVALTLNLWLRRADLCLKTQLGFHLLSVPRVQVAVLEELPVLEARTDPHFVSVTSSDDSSVQICVPALLSHSRGHIEACATLSWQCQAGSACTSCSSLARVHLLDLGVGS